MARVNPSIEARYKKTALVAVFLYVVEGAALVRTLGFDKTAG
jgi:hypothetical protein